MFKQTTNTRNRVQFVLKYNNLLLYSAECFLFYSSPWRKIVNKISILHFQWFRFRSRILKLKNNDIILICRDENVEFFRYALGEMFENRFLVESFLLIRWKTNNSKNPLSVLTSRYISALLPMVNNRLIFHKVFL